MTVPLCCAWKSSAKRRFEDGFARLLFAEQYRGLRHFGEREASIVVQRSLQLSVEELASLGAERLAEILHEISRDDLSLRERLQHTLSESPPVRPRDTSTMSASIERRLTALEDSDVGYGWQGAATLAADVDAMRRDIVERLLPADPEASAGMLERLTDLEHVLFESADDSDGEIGDALRAVVEDWGRAWTEIAKRDPEILADIVFDVFAENEYGVFDEVIPAFAEALGKEGLEVLEARFRSAIADCPEPGDVEDEDETDDEAWRADWNRRMLFRGLEDIADVRGDVDGYIAVQEAAGTHLVYAVEIAERLHRAGRSAEALRWLERPDGQRGYGDDTTDLHVSVLDALGRPEDTRRVLWQAFERTLLFERYRDFRKRTPESERDEIRRQAIDLVLGHDDVHRVLAFLIEVEALAEAENLVLRRAADLRGRDHWTLRPAAKALAQDHPAGAILLYRVLVEAVLNAGKSQYYRYAIGDLREATLLAEGIADWKGLEDDETFMERLRAKHGRKWSFWKQW